MCIYIIYAYGLCAYILYMHMCIYIIYAYVHIYYTLYMHIAPFHSQPSICVKHCMLLLKKVPYLFGYKTGVSPLQNDYK